MAMEERVWKQLRDEANSVKDCFTTFSFQALAFSAIMLGAVASYQYPDRPVVGLAGILVMVVVLTVSRIGGYKYSTANRHFAYELYHDTLGIDTTIGWEVAVRAWRVVAPAIFDRLYLTPADESRSWWLWLSLKVRWSREQLEPSVKKEWKESKREAKRRPEGLADAEARARAERFWFDPSLQVVPVAWHPGRYLQEMQRVLHLVAYLSIIPLVVMALQLSGALGEGIGWGADQARPATAESFAAWIQQATPIAAWVLAIAMLGLVLSVTRELRARRTILESGMLSIPSSAIVWHLAIEAHRRADKVAVNPAHYMRELALYAEQIAVDPLTVIDWLRTTENSSSGTGRGQGATHTDS